MTLAQDIEKMQKEMLPGMPPGVMETFQKATGTLLASGIEKKALKTGDSLPAFQLRHVTGELVSSESLLEKGPLVITFYRGGW